MTRIRKDMRKAIRNGATLRTVGAQYSITGAAVGRILDGAYPDEANAKRLGVPVKCTTCKRNMPKPKQLRQPAPKIGQPGWTDYWMRKIK